MAFDAHKFLRAPYVFYYTPKNSLKLGLLIFVMSTLFNYAFEPFEVNPLEHKMPFFWICAVHGGVSFIILYTGFLWVNTKKKATQHWTVGKEIALLCGQLFVLGLAQFLIRDLIYDNPNNWSWRYALEEVRNTFLVGSLFVFILVPSVYLILNHRNQRLAENLGAPLSPIPNTPKANTIEIKAQTQADGFTLDPKTFIMARAEGNYVAVFWIEAEQIKQQLRRISMKKLEEQLCEIEHIKRTHRSYLVNLHQVKKVSGNAQGLYLLLPENHQALVARNKIEAFKGWFNGMAVD
ncbi:LytTR family DNA-binding domain-containing protein [Sediminicola luteus]|uniref:HTH LytTR-type domain-containing protein n=1 Tax=Sediminicola luteus TaxID=319238 RepID=A0A2A4G5P4_9FLAO|nr:LytTR family DNA-binding domain-containing protein [Sediminicola luteus]PCE63310.1 hypothetical protein B7P33_13915 [Sediminicola luteus]